MGELIEMRTKAKKKTDSNYCGVNNYCQTHMRQTAGGGGGGSIPLIARIFVHVGVCTRPYQTKNHTDLKFGTYTSLGHI